MIDSLFVVLAITATIVFYIAVGRLVEVVLRKRGRTTTPRVPLSWGSLFLLGLISAIAAETTNQELRTRIDALGLRTRILVSDTQHLKALMGQQTTEIRRLREELSRRPRFPGGSSVVAEEGR